MMPETRITEWEDVGRLISDMRRHTETTGERIVLITDPALKRMGVVGWRSIPRNPEDGCDEWRCDIGRVKNFVGDARERADERRRLKLRAGLLGLLSWRRDNPPVPKSAWQRILEGWEP